ncbi:hypothetical protein [uncultured Dokdonia sp.]|uniref:hypothetical protein n=1 Tax=uncultured Dokdonia sp. TaxID=575653 RepID=UPI0030ED40E3|tara:strand:- start:20439 stop:20597 length:159 start_codon:yes stop_codon:yes gene_type:complete
MKKKIEPEKGKTCVILRREYDHKVSLKEKSPTISKNHFLMVHQIVGDYVLLN